MSARSGYLLHPVVLAGLALWLLNDHLLKQAAPGIVTGKLSDVVSLIVFPLLATAVTERSVGRSPRALLVWIAATGAVMATINTLDVAAEGYRVGLAAAQWPWLALRDVLGGAAVPALHRVDLTMDPTDLWTLPALAVPLWVHRRCDGSGLARPLPSPGPRDAPAVARQRGLRSPARLRRPAR